VAPDLRFPGRGGSPIACLPRCQPHDLHELHAGVEELPLLVRAGVVLEMPAWRESVVVPPF